MVMHEEKIPGERIHFAKTVKLGIAFALVLVIGFAGGIGVSVANGSQVIANLPLLGDGLDSAAAPDASLADLWKVWNILNRRYVQTHASTTIPDAKRKMFGAIQGLTASYGDPYTVFFPPVEAKAFQETRLCPLTSWQPECRLSRPAR